MENRFSSLFPSRKSLDAAFSASHAIHHSHSFELESFEIWATHAPSYGIFSREPRLYKRVCPSVGPSVRWFVGPLVRQSVGP